MNTKVSDYKSFIYRKQQTRDTMQSKFDMHQPTTLAFNIHENML